jgi:hypothetical protein
VGRFFSTDPLQISYAFLTPYQFASNRPIDGIDIDGKEYGISTTSTKLEDDSFLVTTHIVVRLKVINNSTVMSGNDCAVVYAEAIKEKVEKENTLSIVTNVDNVTYHHNIKTTVVLDYSPEVDHESVKYAKLIFNDTTVPVQRSVSADGTTTTTTVNYTAGNTSMRYKRGLDFNVNRFEINILIGLNGLALPIDQIAETGNHELGHAAGLNHPWELNNNELSLYPSLNVISDMSDLNAIRSNRMNSNENPQKSSWPFSNTFSSILPEQILYMIDNIKNNTVHDYDWLINPDCQFTVDPDK